MWSWAKFFKPLGFSFFICKIVGFYLTKWFLRALQALKKTKTKNKNKNKAPAWNSSLIVDVSFKPEFFPPKYLYAKVSLKSICLGVGRVEQEWDKHAFQYHVRANFNKYKLFGDNTNSIFNVFQEPKCQVIWNVKKNKNFVFYL